MCSVVSTGHSPHERVGTGAPVYTSALNQDLPMFQVALFRIMYGAAQGRWFCSFDARKVRASERQAFLNSEAISKILL